MSGLGVNENRVTYLKGTQGKFYISTDKEKQTPYDNLVGLLTNIEIKEETFEGNPIDRVYLTISANSGTFKFGIMNGSSTTSNLISFLKSADLSKEIEIIPIAKEGTMGKINTEFLVKQGGTSMKGYFKKGTPTALPRWNKVKFNGKDAWDKTDFIQALNDNILQIQAEVSKNSPVAVTQPSTQAPQQAQSTTVVQTSAGTVTKATVQPSVSATKDEEDSLPF